ncbi:MAG: hypothetical protein ACW9XH_04560 [Candidatus Nitrosopumilus sp. bin_32a]
MWKFFRRKDEGSELDQLVTLFHHPNLKIPPEIRLYLIDDEGQEYVIKDGQFSREYQNDFQYLFAKRGDILDAFARMEFIIGEIIRFHLIGFENGKKDMFIDLISSVGIRRQVTWLGDWHIIDSNLKKNLDTLFQVRNGLAHKHFVEEVSYKNKKFMNFLEDKAFDGFKKDMLNVWKNLLKIYVKYQEKIDYKYFANQIRDYNNFELK